MNHGANEISDKVTVLVFKDNYAARTFQIPLNWISRFGIFLTIIIGLGAISAFLAAKYYFVAAKNDPTHILELEQEVSDLKINIKTLESQVTAPVPLPSVTHKAQNIQPLNSGNNFSAFPITTMNAQTQIPDPASLPFSIQDPKATWRGKTLKVRFALQYLKEDRGHQEGKILILARGPESLFSYPPGTLNRIGSETLIIPDNGESFSVSKFREVQAEFGPLHSQNSILDVEIILFNPEGQILAYQKVTPQKKPEQKQPNPTKESPPE